jgi:hypothetical protein
MGRLEMGVADFESMYATEEDALPMDEHPLVELLVAHYRDFVKWKESRGDLSPAAFNREYGVLIQGPARWPYLEAVRAVCDEAVGSGATSVVVIYGSTPQYDSISKNLGKNEDRAKHLFYMSWQEIHSAMMLVNNDARLLQEIRNRLTKADVVFFVGAPLAVTEMIDQVRAYCDGCLITFA